MINFNSLLTAVAVCLALTSIPASKPAASLPAIPVQVEVGLDSGTKALLESLPRKLREEFINAMNAAMNRLDFSVANYIREIQLAASQTTQEIACTTGGALLNSGNDLKNGLLTLGPVFS